MINVNKHVHYEEITVNFVLNIFALCANLKFQFVRAAISKIYSQTVTTK